MNLKLVNLIRNFKETSRIEKSAKIYMDEPKRISLKISVTYLIIGALWILLSDLITGYYASSMKTMTFINIIKGGLYIAVTGILSYYFLYKELKRNKIIEDELLNSNKELTQANIELEAAYGQLSASDEILMQQNNQIMENQQKLLKTEERLKFLVYHDQLTGLKNSRNMKESFNALISKNSSNISLLYIDIDNFKYINDTLGHSFGDMLLVKISERLIGYQCNNCNVYRLGGDEYIILCEGYKDLGEVEKLAVKMLKEFNNPFEIDKINIFIKISMGIAVYPEHGKCIGELLKNADIAVHKAKELGKNRIIIYNQPMNAAFTERMVIEKHLREALNNNEFELYYQPQMDITDKKISGFEALIRWKNPELGLVLPGRFISIAEATHLIIPIGEWVLKNACVFLKRIHQLGYDEMTISVNISILQLLQDNFVDMVMDTLDLVGVEPKYLEVEITESILIESYEIISAKLKMLNSIGIRIALDDFGKGYSSLNYLRQLPISTLKIDKVFIDTISSKEKNKSIIDLIVKIGKSMDLCVIAEGVETKQQVDYLAKHKCNKIQGYFFSKPLSEKDALIAIETS